MIPVEEARARIQAALPVMPAETVGVDHALGRVLAADVVARRTQPPVAVSSMDGYAVRASDVAAAPATLRTIGSSAAGGGFPGTVGPGQAVRIFTGAPVPAGADTVVIQEDVDVIPGDGGQVRVREAGIPGAHIRPAGLDFREGDVGIRAGRLLTARDVGLAAAMNVPWLQVRRRPRVALLSTGNELVRPGEPIGPSQIVSSNALALGALVRTAGGEPIDLGIAPDDRAELARIAAGAAGADLLVTTGGASVGEHDLIHSVLGDAGASIDFWRIAMRPGKPLMFGRAMGVALLGLPGNPVSALVCALVFLLPGLKAMLGVTEADGVETARLGRDLPANDRRRDYLRSTLARDAGGGWTATPFAKQDSSMLSYLAQADCLVIRPPLAPAAKAGDPVPIVRMDSGLF